MNISPHDESRLSWFFSQGQIAFERSTMGPMLAHAELFGHAGQLRYSERALGYEVQAERIRRGPSAWACVTDGAIVYSGRELTARPTAETRQASGYVPNLRDMEMHAEVSAVLRAVERCCPFAALVLEAYFGDAAADWQRSLPKPGRIGALYHLTEAGARLLEASAAEALKRGQPVASTPARRMANEVAAPKKSERVRVGLLRCERQALVLRAEASAAWCEARAELRAGRAA
jgi:hypothetical protein